MIDTVGTMPRRQLARRLRRLRDVEGYTLEEVARRMETSSSTLSRIEKAEILVDIHLLKDLLEMYRLTLDKWEPYLDLCRQSRKRGWWRDFGLDDRAYAGLEDAANLTRESAMTVVPRLLQTAEYTQVLFDSASKPWPKEKRESEVQIRMIRQRRLYTEDHPLELVAVLDEAALLRRVGGPEVWRDQLAHLIIAAELDTVTIQVVPFECGARPGLDGTFTLLSFDDPEEPDLVYLEHAAGAVHIDRAGPVDRCNVTFDRLWSVALTPADSMALVERLIAQI